MKIVFFLFFFILNTIFYSSANEFINGYHYFILNNTFTKKPKIIEFFSFYCFHCYQFENVHLVNNVLKTYLPEKIKIFKYHANFLGGNMGIQMTKAWIIGIILGVEDKIQPILFEEIQKMHSIENERDLKKIFISNTKIHSWEYDLVSKSKMVQNLLKKHKELAHDFFLNSVPYILVNEKYILNIENIDNSSIENFINEYVSLIKFLLKIN